MASSQLGVAQSFPASLPDELLTFSDGDVTIAWSHEPGNKVALHRKILEQNSAWFRSQMKKSDLKGHAAGSGTPPEYYFKLLRSPNRQGPPVVIIPDVSRAFLGYL